MPAPTTTSEAAERLRLRYPASRVPRFVPVVLVALGAAVALGWLIWTATVHANPPVSGQVLTYRVLSDRVIEVTVAVDRPDPSRAAACHVVAQAQDFAQVGSIDQLAVGPRPEKVVDVTTRIRTLRRATSATVNNCYLR